MKEAIMLLFVCLVPISFFVCTAVMAIKGADYWPLFFIVGAFIVGSIQYEYKPDVFQPTNSESITNDHHP